MARPITWQDVAAPRGLAVAVEAFGRGADRLAQGVGDMAQTAVDYRGDKIKAATDAAIADIANSQDPAAAAAALPKDWTIDPLAIAVAANARDTQLQQKKLTDLSMKNTSLQMERTQAELDDRVAAREAEDIALQYRPAATSGQKLDIDRTDPRWKTAAGKLALDRIDGWERDFQDTKYKQDSLALQRAAAARAQRDDAERRNLDKALGKVVELSGSPDWAGKAPEERDRLIGEVFKGFDVSLSHLDLGQKAYELGFAGNKATPGELGKVDPKTGLSGQKLLDLQAAEVQGAERALNQWKAENASLLRLGQLDATNPYDKVDDVTAANTFLKENPEVTTGWGPNWAADDVIQRVDDIQQTAKKMGKPIERRQAWMLVGKTKGQIKLGDTGVVDDAIRRDIEDFHALKTRGGWEQVAADEKAQVAQFEKAQRDAQRAGAAINAAVRKEGPLPDTLVKDYKTSPITQRQEAEREVASIQLALANADALSSRELASLRKRLDKANATLAALN